MLLPFALNAVESKGGGGKFNSRKAQVNANPPLNTKVGIESVSFHVGVGALKLLHDRRNGRCGLMGMCRREADQFPAGGEAFPFPIFVHQRQTSAAVASNPTRLFRQRERHGQANFQETTFDVTLHQPKPIPGGQASLVANCRLLRISWPRRLVHRCWGRNRSPAGFPRDSHDWGSLRLLLLVGPRPLSPVPACAAARHSAAGSRAARSAPRRTPAAGARPP